MNGDDMPDISILPNGNLTIMTSNPTLAGTYTCRVRYTIYGRTNYVSSNINIFGEVNS